MKWIKAGIVMALASAAFFVGSPLRAAGLALSLDLSGQEGVGAGPVTLVATPLPSSVAFGKNVVIPVEVSTLRGPTNGLTLEIIYDMVDPTGANVSQRRQAANLFAGPIAAPSVTSIALTPHPTKKRTFRGTAFIPRSELLGLRRGGTLHYYFHARRGRQDNYFMKSVTAPTASLNTAVDAPTGPAFETQFSDTFSYPVTPAGAQIVIPDPMQTDGKSALTLDPFAVNTAGTLIVHQDDNTSVPMYRGLQPVVAYSLSGVTLQGTAHVTLSYPADLQGRVMSDQGTYLYSELALYGWHDPEGWRVVSRPVVDATLHTVTGVTPWFTRLALFPAGSIGGNASRPAERIITPNGDGHNDSANFGALDPSEEVAIFDVRGRRVCTVHGPPFIWYGKDDTGKIVESGVYLYQYTSQGERVSGVIVVAK